MTRPHNGHMNNLRAAADRVRPDKVVVMPAGLSPFKQHTSAPGALRLEMCSCFHALEEGMDAIPQLEVSGWEIAQAKAGTTITRCSRWKCWPADCPEGAQLYLAMGSDMLLTFEGWHRWQDILRLARVVVTSRDIGDAPALHAKALRLDPAGARILFAPVQALPMASSDIRQPVWLQAKGCEANCRRPLRAVIRREELLQKRKYQPMNLKQAKELVRSRLSDKRYEHTLNVRKMAVKLAKIYGEDEERAALAAPAARLAKEISKDEMREILRRLPAQMQRAAKSARPGVARRVRRDPGPHPVGL